MSLERAQHTYRGRDGRYKKSELCDGCGKPVGTAHFTDEDVCGTTDGPGFYVCERVRCRRRLAGLGVEARRAIYTATRERLAPPYVNPWCKVERIKKVTHYTMDLTDGTMTEGHTETRTEPCGGPLWTDEEHRSGVCRSCRGGLALIAAVKGAI